MQCARGLKGTSQLKAICDFALACSDFIKYVIIDMGVPIPVALDELIAQGLVILGRGGHYS